MNYFYTDKTTDKIDGEVSIKILGTKDFKGTDYKAVLHSATAEDAVPVASSYDELANKAPSIYEQMVWTQVDDKMMLMVDWKSNGKPAHGPWFPRHIWFGVDPGFSESVAENQSKS